MRYLTFKLSLFIRDAFGSARKGMVMLLFVMPFRTLRFLWRKRIVQTVALAAILYLGIDVGMYLFTPDVEWLARQNPRLTEMMVHQERRPEKSGKRIAIRHTWVPLKRISPHIIQAVIIGEDDKFWHHRGFDFEALQRAFREDIKERKFKSGGSTITQQLAKNLFLKPSKNPVRKLKEAIIAWRMERALKKERILEIYLNVAEWGESIYGVEAAARHYYGKRASSLSPMEAARLAAALPNPRRYSPVGSSGYITNRSRIIYSVMNKRGFGK